METILSSHRDEYLKNIISEQIIFESFLSTVKDFAKDKLGKAIDTVKDWKDAAVVFSQVLSSKELLADFLYPLQRLVNKQLQKLYEKLKKLKLDSILKKIEGFFKKITSLDDWKKLFALIAIGGVALYAANKLPIDDIQSWITKTLGNNFITLITSNLTDWKKYIGFLGTILGGGAIIFNLLQPLLTAFKEALKSNNKWTTKLIKENKTKMKKMKKEDLKQIIKEEILSMLEVDAAAAAPTKKAPPTTNAPSEVINLIKYLQGTGKSSLSQINNPSELKQILDAIFTGMAPAMMKNDRASSVKKFIDAKLK